MRQKTHSERSLAAIGKSTVSGLAGIVFAISATACSSAPDPDHVAIPAPADSLTVAAASTTGTLAVATARIQSYLDSLYTSKDVRYSFVTKFGEDIDCVDFVSEPGVRRLASQARALSAPPKPLQVAPASHTAAMTGPDPLADIFFNGQPDVHGNPRRCPNGTVPHVRLTADRIQRVGGLDAFLTAVHNKSAPKGQTQSPSPSGFLHVTGTFADFGNTQGGQTIMSVFNPNIPVFTDAHSLMQTWTEGTNRTQSVEVGWNVDFGLYGDNNTHLFIFATNDNYQTTGCYNDLAARPGTCLTWVPNSAAGSLALGMTISPTSVVGGSQVEMTVRTLNFNNFDGIPPNWWIYEETPSQYQTIGYYDSNDYLGTMQNAADEFLIGGEAAAPSTTTDFTGVDMGSGLCAEQGFGGASYVRNYQFWDNNLNLSNYCPFPSIDNDESGPPFPYDWSVVRPAGDPSWGCYFYLGGSGLDQCTLQFPGQ